MTRHILLLTTLAGLALCFLAVSVEAQTFQGTHAFSMEDLTFQSHEGFDLIQLAGADYDITAGAPQLPFVELNIALPAGAEVRSFSVIDVAGENIPGLFDILPNPEPVRICDQPPVQPFVRNAAVYNADEGYPGHHGKTLSTWDMAGVEFVTIALYPVQYNPVTREATLATRIDFEVDYHVPAYPAVRTCNYSDKVRAQVRRELQDLAFNPGDLEELPAHVPSTLTALDPGDYEYVIITTTSFASAFQPLADWRTQMGMPAKIVDLTYIYANYTGTTNQLKIRNFIIDANETWGSFYFLMGGDSAYVPYHQRKIQGDKIPNDTYYGDYDSDWRYEVRVGRACVNNSTQINAFIDKVLTYEKNPPAGFGDEVFLMAFDLDSSTPSEIASIKIETDILPAYVNLTTEYDSEGGGHEGDARAYLTAGQNLVNHMDHCGTDYLGVGSVNHGSGFNGSEAQQFNCGTKYMSMNTTGCWPGNFPSTCWGEYLCRDDQGGITFTGNSRYGWYLPGTFTGLSYKYQKKWWEAIYDLNAYRAGAALSRSLNKSYPVDSTGQYIWTELNLLGDPALHFWTKDPVNPVVTHDATCPQGSQDFVVDVNYGGAPIEEALVCLMKGTEVYAYGTTDASGQVLLFIEPGTTGAMTMTVTAQNYRCYESTVTVTSSTAAPYVAGIDPRCSAVTGGATVTVSGFNFDAGSGMTVEVGGQACSGVNIVNGTTLTCNVPAGVKGWQDVTLNNSNGEGVMTEGFLYFPLGPNPFNAVDMHAESLTAPVDLNLVLSGNAGDPYFVYFATGGGPLPTAYGIAGLDATITFLFTAVLPAQQYAQIPLAVPEGYGPIDLYVHMLGVDGGGGLMWAEGGNNPNGTGSVWLHLEN